MKIKNILSLIGLALAVGVTNLHAQFNNSMGAFATGGTAFNVGTNYAIIPAEALDTYKDLSIPPNIYDKPLITGLSVRGFSANAITLQSFITTNFTRVVSTNYLSGANTATNWVYSTNGIIAPQWVVVHHSTIPSARFSDEALYITSIVATATSLSTNPVDGNVYTNYPIQSSTTPVNNVLLGDTIYPMTAAGSLSVASSSTAPTTITVPLFSGQKSKPLLFVLQDVGAAGTNTIDALNATLVP